MYAFDRTGKFIKWSNYFNLNTPELLKASLTLPFPTGQVFNINEIREDENAINLQDYITTSNNLDTSKPFLITQKGIEVQLNTPEAIINFGKVISYINNNGLNITGTSSLDIKKFIVNVVNNHNQYITKLRDSNLREGAIKNQIEYLIHSIILNPTNQIEGQLSVDATTSPFKDLASTSSKVSEAVVRGPGSFTANIHAISNNQVGKKGIGIAAVGMKSFFALTQYYNNVLKSGNEEAIKRLYFDVNILGKEYHTLANISCKNPNEFASELLQWAKNDDDYAAQLSAILSLATDNAKELALAKLNCDTNTMGMWLYGISIGMDFKDVGRIMMSPIGFKLAEALHGNIFNNEDGMSMRKVFKYIDKGPKISAATNLTIKPIIEQIIGGYKKLEELNLSNEDNVQLLYKEIIGSIKKTQKDVVKQELQQLAQWIQLRYIANQDTDEKTGINIYQEFQKLAQGADEMKSLGQILHLNQGLYTNTSDTLTLLNRIERVILNQQYNKTGTSSISLGKFNLHKFLYDEQYRRIYIDSYNAYKTSFNILDMLVNVPHYFEYLKLLDLQHHMNYTISNKYRTIYTIGQKMVNFLGAYSSVDVANIMKRTEQFVDNYITSKWLLETNVMGQHGININLPTGSKYLTIDLSSGNPQVSQKVIRTGGHYTDVFGTPRTVTAMEGMLINLGTANGRASFKYWMESKVIPNLKMGYNGKKTPSGKLIKNSGSPLLSNKFIQNLSPTVFTNTPMKTTIIGYSTGINMSPRTDSDIEVFQEYKNSFNKLKTYGDYSRYYSGTSSYDLTDLFFLYNICTYQNKLGENTLTRLFEDSRDWGIIPSYYDFVNTIDRTTDTILEGDFNEKSLIPYIAPIANKYTTQLEHFLSIDNTTGNVQILSPMSASEIEHLEEEGAEIHDYFDRTSLLQSDYYPTTDLPSTVFSVVNTPNTENELSEENKTYEDENGQIHTIEYIDIHHNQGSITQIKVNGNTIDIPSQYVEYFQHVPTKVVYIDGRPQESYNYKQLIDNIVTLLSKEC